MNENDKNDLRKYLNEEYPHTSGKNCKSSYFAALQHARGLTGRNLKDGTVEKSDDIGNWAGACMYMVLIDHIGEKFENKNKASNKNTPFLKTLEIFTEIEENEGIILYQLRNSFLHQFNLYNLPTNKAYKPRHFSVHRGDILISTPTKEFDGILSNISFENKTSISLFKLGDLVEGIHKLILDLLKKDELIVNVPSGLSIQDLLNANTVCY